VSTVDLSGLAWRKSTRSTANGDNVAWKVSITNPMPLTLEFTGKVSGDAISGEMGVGPMGSFPFSGTRA